MPISDAQFTAWLQRDTPRTVLAEVDFSGQTDPANPPVTGRLYFANRRYSTLVNESPDSQPYHENIVSISPLRRRINGGRSSYSISEIRLANTNGDLDYMRRLAIDGNAVKLYLGDDEWDREDFRLVAVGVVERVSGDESRVVIHCRDKRLLLDRDVRGDAVGGSGPNATKYLPLVWGSADNLEPLLYDDATLTYSVLSNYGGIGSTTALDQVRDGGVPLGEVLFSGSGDLSFSVDDTTDVFTKVAHGLEIDDVVGWDIANNAADLPKEWWDAFPGMSAQRYWVKSVPSADTFTLSATKGGATLDITGTAYNDPFTTTRFRRMRYFDDTENTGRFQLSSPPEGRVTCDLLNLPPGFDDDAPFALAEALIEEFGGEVEIDSAAFAAADTALGAKVDMGYTSLIVLDRRNLISVLDELISSCFGWYGDNGLGSVTCGLYDVSGIAAATPSEELPESDVLDTIEWENLPPTLGRVDINYERNLTPQADGLLASVTDANRAKYSKPYQKIQRSTQPAGQIYLTNKPLYHRTMVDGAPRNVDAMDATAFGTNVSLPLGDYADEVVADSAPNLCVARVPVGLDKYDWPLGGIVEFTHSRFGWSGGVNFMVVGIELDLMEERVNLEMLTQTEPVLTAVAYN